MTIRRSCVCLSLAAAVCLPAAILVAGNLNPPKGPVAPTMVNNQQIFDAVNALGGSGGSAACSAAIPGLPRALGSVTFSNLPGVGGSLGPHTFYSFSQPISDFSALDSAGDATILVDLGDTAHRFYNAVTLVGPPGIISAVTLEFNDGVSNHFSVTLADARIRTMRVTMVQRCDGTTAQVAELVMYAITTVRYTNSTGNFWEWNNLTNSGNGG